MVILQLDQQPALIQAIFVGEIENVRSALEFNLDVNYQDCEKRTPLHAAAFKGDVDIASLLLSYGARVNTKDSQWITPLHRACYSGSSELVSLLLKYQADVTARDKQWQTPLHVAAANNAGDVVSQLLECVPNCNVTDRMGRTALHHAAANGHINVVHLLLSKGCIANACDKKDCRPLHCAAHMAHTDIIKVLLEYGADINAKDRNQYTPLHVAASSGTVSACQALLKAGAEVDVRNAYGNTPLHIACLNGHLPVCNMLVSYGADLELTNYRGQTPLHIAAASAYGVDCLNFLVGQKADINKQSLDGRSALHMTAIHGRFTRSKTLIDNGSIVDCEDKNGCTALHIAAQYGHDLLSNTLLLYGADPARKGYLGRTPLHMSCLSGQVECCRKFLQAGVDLNAVDDSGKTPVHCATYKGSVECLDLLVSNGADFHLQDNIGRSPLHYAAVQGHYPCVFTLVGLGSNVNLCDAEGCSPLHLAAAYDLKGGCVEYLLARKADPKLKDNKGYTSIHYAVVGENSTGLRFLLGAVGLSFVMCGPSMPLTTPLHLASHAGNQEILQMILSYFHDTNIRTEQGSTALLLAAKSGNAHCVQLLLRYGAKVAITDNLFQMGPVHYSAKRGHMHCLALLLDNTEEKNVIDKVDSLQRTPLMLAVAGGHTDSVLTLLKCGADSNVMDKDQHSSLFRAVVNGNNNIVQMLLSYGVSVDNFDIHGKTVLHLSAGCGHLACMQMLFDTMQQETITALDKQGCTALHWACYNGNPHCVSYLLHRSVFKDLSGNAFSPVHCATFVGAEPCLELLCNFYGPDVVKLKDARNRTPLHIAALHGHVDCAKFLLKKGAEIDSKDSDGRTPLIAAAQNGQSQILDILLSNKADVASYDNNGNTALHLACLKRHSHAALLLLESIEDIDIVNMINNDRKTALHLAARNGLVSVTRQLITKGSSVLAVDSSGMTPALCCAPNTSVAQCLALILANYTICSQQNLKESSPSSFPPISEFSLKKRKRRRAKTYQTQSLQTDLSLMRDFDRLNIQYLLKKHRKQLEAKLQGNPKSAWKSEMQEFPSKDMPQELFKRSKEPLPSKDCFLLENYKPEETTTQEWEAGYGLHRSFSDMVIANNSYAGKSPKEGKKGEVVRLSRSADGKNVTRVDSSLINRCLAALTKDNFSDTLQGVMQEITSSYDPDAKAEELQEVLQTIAEKVEMRLEEIRLEKGKMKEQNDEDENVGKSEEEAGCVLRETMREFAEQQRLLSLHLNNCKTAITSSKELGKEVETTAKERRAQKYERKQKDMKNKLLVKTDVAKDAARCSPVIQKPGNSTFPSQRDPCCSQDFPRILRKATPKLRVLETADDDTFKVDLAIRHDLSKAEEKPKQHTDSQHTTKGLQALKTCKNLDCVATQIQILNTIMAKSPRCVNQAIEVFSRISDRLEEQRKSLRMQKEELAKEAPVGVTLDENVYTEMDELLMQLEKYDLETEEAPKQDQEDLLKVDVDYVEKNKIVAKKSSCTVKRTRSATRSLREGKSHKRSKKKGEAKCTNDFQSKRPLTEGSTREGRNNCSMTTQVFHIMPSETSESETCVEHKSEKKLTSYHTIVADYIPSIVSSVDIQTELNVAESSSSTDADNSVASTNVSVPMKNFESIRQNDYDSIVPEKLDCTSQKTDTDDSVPTVHLESISQENSTDDSNEGQENGINVIATENLPSTTKNNETNNSAETNRTENSASSIEEDSVAQSCSVITGTISMVTYEIVQEAMKQKLEKGHETSGSSDSGSPSSERQDSLTTDMEILNEFVNEPLTQDKIELLSVGCGALKKETAVSNEAPSVDAEEVVDELAANNPEDEETIRKPMKKGSFSSLKRKHSKTKTVTRCSIS